MEWVAGLYSGVASGGAGAGAGVANAKGKGKEGDGVGLEEARKMLKPTFARFEYHVHKTLCSLR